MIKSLMYFIVIIPVLIFLNSALSAQVKSDLSRLPIYEFVEGDIIKTPFNLGLEIDVVESAVTNYDGEYSDILKNYWQSIVDKNLERSVEISGETSEKVKFFHETFGSNATSDDVVFAKFKFGRNTMFVIHIVGSSGYSIAPVVIVNYRETIKIDIEKMFDPIPQIIQNYFAETKLVSNITFSSADVFDNMVLISSENELDSAPIFLAFNGQKKKLPLTSNIDQFKKIPEYGEAAIRMRSVSIDLKNKSLSQLRSNFTSKSYEVIDSSLRDVSGTMKERLLRQIFGMDNIEFIVGDHNLVYFMTSIEQGEAKVIRLFLANKIEGNWKFVNINAVTPLISIISNKTVNQRILEMVSE